MMRVARLLVARYIVLRPNLMIHVYLCCNDKITDDLELETNLHE